MRRWIPLTLALCGCPGLPDSGVDTDPGTDPDTDTDTQACVEDLLEDNDTQDMATPLVIGDLVAAQVCADDDDWYAVRVPAYCTGQVDVAFVHDDGDLDVEVYNAEVRVGVGSSTTDDEVARFTASQDTAFDVVVRGFDGAENAYTVLPTITCPACVAPDVFEDNDDLLTAAIVAFPITADVCGDDLDFYQLPVTTPGCAWTVSLDVTEGAAADAAVSLLDAASGLVVAEGAPSATGEALRTIVAGPASLRVVGVADARYTLDASEVCAIPAPTCALDDGWDNQTSAIALPDGSAADALVCVGVADRWVVPVLGDCPTHIAVTAATDTRLVITDVTGATIYDDVAPTHELVRNTVPGDAFAVTVSAPPTASDGVAYTISAATVCAR